jgi:putative intracellular protease/amidase
VLFDDFETLDAFGPAEVFGRLPGLYEVNCFSLHGGLATSSQRIQVLTRPFAEMGPEGVLLIPGGMGTRSLVDDEAFIKELARLAGKARFVLTVCTGSALFAKTGLLDGRKATSNKQAFAWAQSTGPKVAWAKRARWVADGNIYTSSGVSAGIDMALGFVKDIHGQSIAYEVRDTIEYVWHEDKDADPFAL